MDVTELLENWNMERFLEATTNAHHSLAPSQQLTQLTPEHVPPPAKLVKLMAREVALVSRTWSECMTDCRQCWSPQNSSGTNPAGFDRSNDVHGTSLTCK